MGYFRKGKYSFLQTKLSSSNFCHPFPTCQERLRVGGRASLPFPLLQQSCGSCCRSSRPGDPPGAARPRLHLWDACPLRKAEDPSLCDSGLMNSESGTLAVNGSRSTGFYHQAALCSYYVSNTCLHAALLVGRECTGRSPDSWGDDSPKNIKHRREVPMCSHLTTVCTQAF